MLRIERYPLESLAGPGLTHARVRAVRMAGYPVIYAGSDSEVSAIFALSPVELPYAEKIGGGFWRLLNFSEIQAGDRFFPLGSDGPVLLAGGELLKCVSDVGCSGSACWTSVSYFKGATVEAAFAANGEFLAVLENGSVVAVALSPGAASPRFASAELQARVSGWDVFPQGTSLETWLALDAKMNARRALESEVRVLSPGFVAFAEASSSEGEFVAVEGAFLQVVVCGGRVFGLGQRGEVFLGEVGGAIRKMESSPCARALLPVGEALFVLDCTLRGVWTPGAENGSWKSVSAALELNSGERVVRAASSPAGMFFQTTAGLLVVDVKSGGSGADSA